MKDLIAIAEQIAARLVARKETIAVAESSTGGLISASLLAVPGASAYFLGGAVVYTRDARRLLAALGTVGDRRHRPRRQPLWRCRRPQLHGGGGACVAGHHDRDRQRRPA